MSYVEIKLEIDKTEEMLIEKDKERYEHESEIELIVKSLDEKKSNKDLELKRAEERERLEYEESLEEPFNRKKKELEDAKTRASLKRDDKLLKINDGSYSNKYKSQVNIDGELEYCKEIKEKTSNFYGKEFTEMVETLVPDNYEKPEDLSQILNELNVVSSVLTKSFSLSDYVHNFLSTIDPNEKNENQVYISTGIGIVLLIGSIILYPILLVGMILSIVYSCYKSYFFIRATISRKSLEKNVLDIKEDLDKRISQAIEKDKATIERNYQNYIQKLDKQIQDVETECLIEVESQRENFIFDGSGIESSYASEKQSIENKLDLEHQNLRHIEDDIKALKVKLRDLESQLDSSLRNLTIDYMPSGIPSNCRLPDDYLIDIVNDTPDLFKAPRESAIFIYNEDTEYDNFINLLFYQTVSRISPEMIKFFIIDKLTLGVEFLKYTDYGIVDISDDDEKIKTVIEGCNYEMKKRNGILSQDYSDIIAYNDFMIDNDCPAETYNFIMYKTNDLNSLLNMQNSQILTNGGRVGYYEYIFINMGDLCKCGEDTINSACGYAKHVYSIERGRVRKRAKEFILSRLER